ncbi:hypothetical protein ACKP2L_05180 [Oenococcus alcoholitolerans]|uniref:hypothetical protein n=1 Tax=Oenococcus alcoholitolerans TaxID=931074 RepID=UPI003F726A37
MTKSNSESKASSLLSDGAFDVKINIDGLKNSLNSIPSTYTDSLKHLMDSITTPAGD